MEITGITLATSRLAEVREFYADTLGLSVSRTVPFTVAAWLADRVPLHTFEGEPIIHFDSLDADVVYFDDPAGNVLECISYGTHESREFTPDGIVNVTEVGLPIHDASATVRQLNSELNAPVWGEISDDPARITRVRDARGRLIVVQVGRPWFPTGRESTAGPITVEAAVGRAYEHPTLPYRIGPEDPAAK